MRTRILISIFLSCLAPVADATSPVGPPSLYAFNVENLPAIDATASKKAYVQLAQESYGNALSAAQTLDTSIQAFAKKPELAEFKAAKRAWRAARAAYLPTEVFRYFDSPIDAPESGPESRINSWPVNEAVMDYVSDAGSKKDSGLVANNAELSLDAIQALDQVNDEADVTTGFHALEFMLWGQDFNDAGPGQRPVTDYSTDPLANRRKEYVLLLSRMLVRDLSAVNAQWQANGDYAKEFLAFDDREALGRMLRGSTMLVVEELASERLAVALDSGMQEDETSCFSDNTHREFAFGLAGVDAVWNRAVKPLLQKTDAKSARAIDAALSEAKARSQFKVRFESVLLADADSAERVQAEALVAALNELGQTLHRGGKKLGVLTAVAGVH
jgi:putative iron-regulated protein